MIIDTNGLSLHILEPQQALLGRLSRDLLCLAITAFSRL